MDTKMRSTARPELANAPTLSADGYRSATGKEKRKILDEFVATTGYHEKSAIRVLNGQQGTEQRQTRNRPSLYDEATRGARRLKLRTSAAFGVRLRGALRLNGGSEETGRKAWVTSLTRQPVTKLREATRQTAHAHQESTETIVELLDVSQDAHR